VKKGETLTGIAKSNGMTLKDIRSLNGFSENVNVKIGQKIKVKSNEKSSSGKDRKNAC
jgi:N-acetylmuramoyl-L-alanine amidase